MKQKNKTGAPALFMTLRREPFEQILKGVKREEYREITDYWRRRLIGREYSSIIFQNGYNTNSPRIEIEYKGMKKKFIDGSFFGVKKIEVFALQLGKILNTKNLKVN